MNNAPAIHEQPLRENAEKISEAKKQAENWIRDVFYSSSDMNERLHSITKRLESFFAETPHTLLSDNEKNRVLASIQSCTEQYDIDTFVHTLTTILQPLIILKALHPTEFEAAQAASMNEANDFITINRLLSYKKDGPMLHFHAPAGKTVENKISLYRSGMRDLAKIVDKDPGIQEISATSHLVAEHESLFQKAGFLVENVPQNLRDTHFADEKRKVKYAHISREDFLARFSKNAT